MKNDFDTLLDAHTEAPYGFKKDGTPRKRPVNTGLKQFNPKSGPQKPQEPQKMAGQDDPAPAPAPSTQQSASRELKRLHKRLNKLGSKAITKLSELLDDPDKRVRLQAAGVATRASLMGLAKDALGSGQGAEIHIHTTVQAQVGPAPGLAPAGQHDPTRAPAQATGKPRMITE